MTCKPSESAAWIVFFCWAGYLLPTDIAASTHPPTYSSRNASHEAPTHPQKVSPQVVCIGTMALAGPLRLRRLIVRVVPAPPARCRLTPPHRALLSQLSPSGNFKQLTGPTHGPDSDGAAPLRPPSGRRKMHRLLLRRRRNFFPPARGQRGGRASCGHHPPTLASSGRAT